MGRMQLSELITQVRRRLTYVARQFLKQVRQDLSSSFAPFEINLDPACLHLPWSRDRDAIHIVSSRSVLRYTAALGMKFDSRSGVSRWYLNRAPEILLKLTKTVEN